MKLTQCSAARMSAPFFSGLGLGIVFLCLMSAPLQALDDPAAALQTTQLDNGLMVLTLEDHSTPVVAVQIWVKAGSKDESFYTGIAHLFEHMMFKGSKNVAPEEHARLVGSRGGRINAYTSRDVTVYHEDVTAESLPLVLALEAERFAHLDISETNLESEREVVLEERRLRVDDQPGGLAFESLAAIAWQAHPYRWPVIGWRADIEAVTVEACQDFFDTYYAANNLVLVIVGDIDTEETLALVEKEFGVLKPATSIPRNPGKVVDQRGERRARIHLDARIELIYGAWHAPAAGHPDADALDVASQILSAGRSSRLYRKLVYQDEQALYAEGGYWALQEAGLFFAVAGARPGVSLDVVEQAFLDQIELIQQDGVTEEEVAKAKRQMEVGFVHGLSTTHALASRVGQETVFFGRVRSLDERLASINAVTPADVQRVVSQYLVPESRTVVHVLDSQNVPESGLTQLEEAP